MAIKKLDEILAAKQKQSLKNARQQRVTNPQKSLKKDLRSQNKNQKGENLGLFGSEKNNLEEKPSLSNPSGDKSNPRHQSSPTDQKSPFSLYIPKNQYISTPAQLRALGLASKFNDSKHKLQYLQVCKNIHPAIIDRAESLVADAQARKAGALFMWYIKKIRQEWQETGKDWHAPHSKDHKKRPRSQKPPQQQPPSLFDD